MSWIADCLLGMLIRAEYRDYEKFASKTEVVARGEFFRNIASF